MPTEIAYTPDGKVDKWGFEIKPNQKRLSWFKLLLEPPRYATIHTPALIQTKNQTPILDTKRPVDVVADYLSCLRNHTLERLKRTYSRAFLAETPIDYIMTVPAVRVLLPRFGCGGC